MKKMNYRWIFKQYSTGSEYVQVRILAESEGYAMVRRKGAFPFIVTIKDFMPENFTPPIK